MSKYLALPSISLLLILAIVLGSWSCAGRDYAGQEEALRIGTPLLESSALIYIAESKGYFRDNGLAVSLKSYDTGAASLNGLLNREVEIATPAEYALVGKAFQNEQVSALASIDKVQYFFLIGRQDRGITDIADLKGKRIGVVFKTISEFYLGRFLQLNGMDMGQIVPVNIDVSQSEEAILSGELDAIISRPPYVSGIQQRLGSKAVIWPVQSNQSLFALIIGRNDWLAEHPETATRLLKSLAQAEKYLVANPDEAKSIVQKKLSVDEKYMSTVWTQNQFSLTLEQSLITAMEDEARWMVANGLATANAIPDFGNHVQADGLRAVKPEAVSIVR